MKFTKKLNAYATIIGLAATVSAGSAEAATALAAANEFTPEIATQTLEVRADGWYNLTMGYRGWTHHSSWGHMTLKKDRPVTIKVTSATTGFHPGITVWFRPQKKGYAPVEYMFDHFYNQFTSILEPKATVNDDAGNPVQIGTIKMDFVSNAFDRDGMGETIPGVYDQSMLNRSLDGTAGEVSLSFTPKETGVYQFVVAGINPGSELKDPNTGKVLAVKYPVDVTVSFPK